MYSKGADVFESSFLSQYEMEVCRGIVLFKNGEVIREVFIVNYNKGLCTVMGMIEQEVSKNNAPLSVFECIEKIRDAIEKSVDRPTADVVVSINKLISCHFVGNNLSFILSNFMRKQIA